MHRRLEADLLPLDTEIERTQQNQRKITSVESRNMANQRERLQTIQEEEEEEEEEINQRPNTMEDFWRPIIEEKYSVVRQPLFEANNFELKPTLITIVQQPQFTSHPSEDSNQHMGRFMRMANIVKLNEMRPEVIKLQLFAFLLRDVGTTWLDSLSVGSMNTWEELVEAYMSIFFPPYLIVERRREIIVFKQGEEMRASTLHGRDSRDC